MVLVRSLQAESSCWAGCAHLLMIGGNSSEPLTPLGELGFHDGVVGLQCKPVPRPVANGTLCIDQHFADACGDAVGEIFLFGAKDLKGSGEVGYKTLTDSSQGSHGTAEDGVRMQV